MPITRNTLATSDWPAYPGTHQLFRRQTGYNSLPGEDKRQVLFYSGYKDVGFKLKMNPAEPWVDPNPASAGVLLHEMYSFGTVYIPSWGEKAASQSYAKLREAATGSSAQLGTFLAERKEAYGMIANRAMGLYRSYKELRRGNFRRFLKELSVNPKRKHRNKTRAAAHEVSGLWLEYWFGWSPSVNDMFTAASVLGQELPAGQVFTGSSGVYKDRKQAIGWFTRTEEALWIHKTGAQITLTNPDLFLASQWGLTNPLSIAWEVVPFSFVVDWFTGFGNYLSSLTDWLGVEIKYPFRGSYFKRWATDIRITASGVSSAEFFAYGSQRRVGLQRPIPTRPKLLNYGNSNTRALTASSLLTTLFLGK